MLQHPEVPAVLSLGANQLSDNSFSITTQRLYTTPLTGGQETELDVLFTRQSGTDDVAAKDVLAHAQQMPSGDRTDRFALQDCSAGQVMRADEDEWSRWGNASDCFLEQCAPSSQLQHGKHHLIRDFLDSNAGDLQSWFGSRSHALSANYEHAKPNHYNDTWFEGDVF